MMAGVGIQPGHSYGFNFEPQHNISVNLVSTLAFTSAQLYAFWHTKFFLKKIQNAHSRARIPLIRLEERNYNFQSIELRPRKQIVS